MRLSAENSSTRLNANHLMFSTSSSRCRLDLLHHATSILQQEVCRSHFAFLQFLVGIQRGDQLVGMAQDLCILPCLGSRGLVAYALQLVAHFRSRIFSGVNQRPV